jgi:hypothetical protein
MGLTNIELSSGPTHHPQLCCVLWPTSTAPHDVFVDMLSRDDCG